MTETVQNEVRARCHRERRYLPPDGLQMAVQETKAFCQRDAGDGDEEVHEVPGERGHSCGRRGKGCTGVGVGEVLEQVVVTLQHVLAKYADRGVGVLRRKLHVVVLVEQVFHCNRL